VDLPVHLSARLGIHALESQHFQVFDGSHSRAAEDRSLELEWRLVAVGLFA
jgi:hypothetical protein